MQTNERTRQNREAKLGKDETKVKKDETKVRKDEAKVQKCEANQRGFATSHSYTFASPLLSFCCFPLFTSVSCESTKEENNKLGGRNSSDYGLKYKVRCTTKPPVRYRGYRYVHSCFQIFKGIWKAWKYLNRVGRLMTHTESRPYLGTLPRPCHFISLCSTEGRYFLGLLFPYCSVCLPIPMLSLSSKLA